MRESVIGRTYGPYTYEAGAEKIREFALAIGGGVPSSVYDAPAPADLPRAYLDGERVIAPPTFCVTFALKPFAAAIDDPAVGIDKLRLVHGEQAFEFIEPVRAGDTLTTVGTITGLIEKAGKEFLTVTTVSKNQHGREVVRGTWTAVVIKAA